MAGLPLQLKSFMDCELLDFILNYLYRSVGSLLEMTFVEDVVAVVVTVIDPIRATLSLSALEQLLAANVSCFMWCRYLGGCQ
jgi:hypothetical protein